jgi:hypothetical protein
MAACHSPNPIIKTGHFAGACSVSNSTYYLPHGGAAMRKHHDKQNKVYIGTLEVAELLNCHPMSIPRYVKTKKGFPKPGKLSGKNVWDRDLILEFRAAEIGRHS